MPLSEVLDMTDTIRRLGYVAPTGDNRKLMRASRTSIQTLRSNNGLPPLIPQSQWTECDYVTGYPADLIDNQGQEGACTAASNTGAYARQEYIRSGTILNLSWPFVYDQINDGRDNGSNIIDSMGVIESVGAPPLTAYPKSLWVADKIPAGAPMYKEDVAMTLATSDECATALLMGVFPQVPILVSGNFEQFTGDGVAWGGRAPRSNNSNHSIYLGGLKQIAGVWHFILVNSWGAQWGPFQAGWCYIPLTAVDNPSQVEDGYAHSSTVKPVTV